MCADNIPKQLEAGSDSIGQCSPRLGQAGFSLLEALVATLVLSITAFALVASQVAGISMQRNASLRHAATVVGQQAVQPLIAASQGTRAGVVSALSAFPRTIYSYEARKSYQVSVRRIEDSNGNVVSVASLPSTHAVLMVTLDVPYMEAREQKSVYPICAVSY